MEPGWKKLRGDIMIRQMVFLDLKQRFKQPGVYINFSLLFLLGFMAVYRGSHGSGILTILTQAGRGQLNANAPHVMFNLISTISNYCLMFAAFFMANTAYKDFKHKTSNLVFSYPIKEIDYISSRLIENSLTILLVLSGTGFGAYFASISALSDPEHLGIVTPLSMLMPYLYSVIPNVFMLGAAVYSTILISRSYKSIFGLFACFLILEFVALTCAMNGLHFWASIIDPSGKFAYTNTFNYLTLIQKNTLQVSLSGEFLVNRLIILALGAGSLLTLFSKFAFNIIPGNNKHSIKDIRRDAFRTNRTILPLTTRIFSGGIQQYFSQMFPGIKFELIHLVKNRTFLFFLFSGGLVALIFGFSNVGIVRGTTTYPTTTQLLETIKFPVHFFNSILILYLAGETIWSSRRHLTADLIDVLPASNWLMLSAKVWALFLIQFLYVSIVFGAALSIQIWHGYYHFELVVYFLELFVNSYFFFCVFLLFAVFCQILFNNKYIAYVVTILFEDDLFPILGFDHHLLRFGSKPDYVISDMNGYGPFLKAILYYDIYWLALSLILTFFALLLFVRGRDRSFIQRLVKLKQRYTRKHLRFLVPVTAIWIITGCTILYNTTVLNDFASEEYINQTKAEYETVYKRYETLPQVQIIDIELRVDLYPQERKYITHGTLILENISDQPLSTLFVQLPPEATHKYNSFDMEFETIDSSNTHGVSILNLKLALQPGERFNYDYAYEIMEKGFKDIQTNTSLINNGTFLQTDQLVPRFGYNTDFSRELDESTLRKKYDLSTKTITPSIYDEEALEWKPTGKDSDWLNFEAIISTDSDQIALTTGELVNKWTENKRNYFHYKSPVKQLNYFPLISGRYDTFVDQWKDVDIEMYYHPEHDYNIELMVSAAQKSLDYFTENFGDYPSKEIRFVEFPKYEIYAECFANLIPISEGYGFIAKFDTSGVEYAFRVVAHELAHQWWGHQVMGANVEGAYMLTETLAEYSAIMLVEKEYELAKVQEYLKQRIDIYLKLRARATEPEVPLFRTTPEREYLHYNKGMVVMYALKDYIGESTINTVLREFRDKYKFQSKPHPTSINLIDRFRDATPDSLKYIITDMFETITYYDNKTTAANVSEVDEDKYLVSIQIDAHKYQNDDSSAELEVSMNDYISIGAMDEDGKTIYLKKHWIKSGASTFQFLVNQRPFEVGLDPYNYLIEMDYSDNIISIEETI